MGGGGHSLITGRPDTKQAHKNASRIFHRHTTKCGALSQLYAMHSPGIKHHKQPVFTSYQAVGQQRIIGVKPVL